MNIVEAIPIERIPTSGYVAVLLYFPIGLLLAVFRLFLTVNFLCSQVFFNIVFSKKNFLRRAYESIFLAILGVVLIEKDSKLRSNKSVLVSNSIAKVDQFFLTVLSSCYVETNKALPRFIMDLFRFLPERTLLSRFQLFVQPEPHPTDGKSLLKFCELTSPMAASHAQPIAIKLYRPLPISGTTIDSSVMSDLFWMYFSIFNVYEVKYLPVLRRSEDQAAKDFVEKIRKKISEELGVECTSYDASDINEFIRRRKFEARKPQEHLQTSASTPRVREMIQQVKDVLPHVPNAVIKSDLERTRSVDVTVTNLLEGVVSYVPETQTSSTPKPSKIPFACSAKKTLPVHSFSTFEERKEAFINEARENYLKKRGLK